VPRKLEIEVQIPGALKGDIPIDLEKFRGVNGVLQPGEVGLPVEAVPEAEVEVDMEVVNQLVQMGLPELSAKHAAHATAGQDADAAVMWFYSNIENPILNGPLPKVAVA